MPRWNFVLFFLFLILASCEWEVDYFGEYAGRNLIEDYDLDHLDWSAMADPLYMDFSDAGELGPSGTPAYWLHSRNLYPQGKFTGGSPGFVPQGGATTQVFSSLGDFISGGTTFRPIEGASFGFDLGSSTEIIEADLSGASFSAGAAGSYMLHFDYRTTDYLVYQLSTAANGRIMESGTSWGPDGLLQQDLTMVNLGRVPSQDGSLGKISIPSIEVSGASTPVFSFGLRPGVDAGGLGINVQKTVIDNFRFLRTDVTPGISLTLPSLQSTSLELLPGIYEFTIFVKDDVRANDVAQNIFHPSGVTIRVISETKSGSQTFTRFTPRPGAGWPDWTALSWRQSIDFPGQDPDDPLDNVLEIQIIPTDNLRGEEFRDLGSLLIAEPRLLYRER